MVTPIQAKLTRDLDTFSKMDPYAVVRVGGQTFATKVHEGGGKTPGWNEKFSFRRTTEDIVNVQVWDRDTFSKNDMVGEGNVSFSEVSKGNYCSWVNLSYKGIVAAVEPQSFD